jgi:class 3 adenylate cyclase/predicted ATPase
MVVCGVCGAESTDGARFCATCGAPLADSQRAVRKTVTVLFCDVVGSTALGESTDPEAVRALLARYFNTMKSIVEGHGGTVEKFIGDAVMAVFGVPVVHEDDALRAVRAAEEMLAALPDLGVEGRIGIDTGEVVTGTAERLATGDAVNVAARLQSAAGPGEILIGAQTRRLGGEAVGVEELTPLELKGKAKPVPAFRLIAVHGPLERQHESRFVGRSGELDALETVWRRVMDEERCELVTVVGEPGVGKSRLVAEFVGGLGSHVVQGRCLSYGEGITYWPVIEVVKQLDRLPADPAAATAIQTLLCEADGITSAEAIAWAFRKLLEEAGPLVAVFDDIQWGEETFLDLLEHVVLLSAGTPLLLVCLARPELTERRPQWPVALRLGPLPPTEVDALLPATISTGLRERIARASGGNPLFVHEMVAFAAEAGDEVEVPPTLKALLATRLDGLEIRERSVLEAASVEGELFHRGAVQALAPTETQVTPRLAGLVRKELIRPDRPQFVGEDGFRFRHLLIRDAAYDALPKATRAELHERFAAWLERTGASLVELDEIVGYHLEQAVRYKGELAQPDAGRLALAAEAARRLATAGHRAFDHGDLRATVSLLERAAALLPEAAEERVRILVELGQACPGTGLIERGQQALHEARRLLEDGGDDVLSATVEIELLHARLYSAPEGVLDEALELAGQLLPRAEAVGDEALLARVWRLIGEVNIMNAHFGDMEASEERALEHARHAGDYHQEALAMGWLGPAVRYGPTPATAGLARLERVLDEGRGKPTVEVALLLNMAPLDGMLGEPETGRARLDRALAICDEYGNSLQRAFVLMAGGELELIVGEYEAAEESQRRGCELLEAMGDKSFLSTIAAQLAHALVEQGRYDEADEYVELSRTSGASYDIVTQVFWRSARAAILSHRGESDAAESLIREARAFAERTDELNLRAETLRIQSQVLAANGRTAEAIGALEEALELAEAKEDLPLADRLHQRLDALRDG